MKRFAILCLAFLSLGSSAQPWKPIDNAPNGRVYVDPLYGYTLAVPDGWFVAPTPAGAIYGAAVFFNYDPQLAWETGNLPPGATRVQIGIAPVRPGEDTAAWVARWRASTTPGSASQRGPATAAQATRIGEYEAFRYRIESTAESVVEVDMRVYETQMAAVGIYADGDAGLDQALGMLATLKPKTGHTFTHEALRSAQAWARAPLWAIPETVETGDLISGSCPYGTFAGNEAPDSPVRLNMPFRAGQRWMVGNWGSFYGNGFHCNSNNDYYATDWNRIDGSTNGSDILPVADGTIDSLQLPTCPTTGYGCYVRLVHAGGIRTAYAHLSGVYRAQGFVTHADAIGAAGSTGSSNGPHLHMVFRQTFNGRDYYSRCYNNGATCPNGEAPVSPQTAKPSPMHTANGLVKLVDGGIYTSMNSGEVKLYDAPGFTGTVVFSGMPGFSDGPNRDARSMSIPVGWSVKTWRADNRAGESGCWTAAVPDLAAIGWANAIDSIEIFDTNVCPPPVPDSLSPAEGGYAGEGRVTLSWSARGEEHYGELWYQLVLSPALTSTLALTPTPELTRTVTISIAFGWQPTATAVVGPLTATHPYSWHVMTRNANGESGWSPTQVFTILPPKAFAPLVQRERVP